MCGFFGVVDIARLQAGAAFERHHEVHFDALRDRIAHRGPDAAATHASPGVLLGHRRLSILDLSPDGAQPMVSPAGTVLVFNGEIYNYVELRADLRARGETFHSTGDTEVLLRALDVWGFDATLQRLRGMFAFAAWNPQRGELWLARDHVGKKPLFVGQHGDALAFGSALEPVAAWLFAQGMPLQVEPIALDQILAAGWVTAPHTGVVGIRKLPPATALTIRRDGSSDERRFWTIPFVQRHRRLDTTTLGELRLLFEAAITRRLRSDVPVATFLSGGLDSSLVTAAASRQHGRLTAYTVRTGDGNEHELDLATRIARHLGLDHRVLDLHLDPLAELDALIPMYGEPFADSSSLATAAISRLAGREHRVVLTGDGGDEVQGGYLGARLMATRALLWAGDGNAHSKGQRLRDGLRRPLEWGLDAPSRRASSRLPGTRFRLLRLLGTAGAAMTVRDDGLDLASSLLTPQARQALGDDAWPRWLAARLAALQAQGAESALEQQLGFDFAHYLADDLNVKVDVASMAASVETRAPLLDVDFVTASWSIRPLDRVRPWKRKRIIEALARTQLPESLLIREKRGFSVPIHSWLQAPALRAEIDSGLADLPAILRPWLDGGAAASMLQRRADAGVASHVHRWRLLVLLRWARWLTTMAQQAVTIR